MAVEKPPPRFEKLPPAIPPPLQNYAGGCGDAGSALPEPTG